MLRIKVSKSDGALRVQVLEAKSAVIESTEPPSSYPGWRGDVPNIPNIGAYFDKAPYTLRVASSASTYKGYGIGFLNYAIAPEMVPSLAAPAGEAPSPAALLGKVAEDLERKLGSTREPVPGGEPPTADELFTHCLDGCPRVTVQMYEYAASARAGCAKLAASDLSCFAGDECVDVRRAANDACPGIFDE
jgi:hypothetical protein